MNSGKQLQRQVKSISRRFTAELWATGIDDVKELVDKACRNINL